MTVMNCVVCDPDEQYARKLAEFINRRKEFHLTAQPFTDPGKLLRYAEKEKVDLLLINERQINERISREVLSCCVFTEEETAGQFQRKYSSAVSLVRYALRQARTISAGQGNLLAVYSPVGRCGKTCFALTLAGVLATKAPVLYLNLEDYPWFGLKKPSGPDAAWEAGEGPTLSDLLYSVHAAVSGEGKLSEQDAVSIRASLERTVKTRGGLDLVTPAYSSCDLRDIPTREWKIFLNMLGTDTHYDYLVLDIGCQMPDVFQILSMCGNVYMPVLDDPASSGKTARFEMTLRSLRGEEGMLEQKIRKLKLPPVQGIDIGRDDFLEELLHSPMGQAASDALRSGGIW